MSQLDEMQSHLSNLHEMSHSVCEWHVWYVRTTEAYSGVIRRLKNNIIIDDFFFLLPYREGLIIPIPYVKAVEAL